MATLSHLAGTIIQNDINKYMSHDLLALQVAVICNNDLYHFGNERGHDYFSEIYLSQIKRKMITTYPSFVGFTI